MTQVPRHSSAFALLLAGLLITAPTGALTLKAQKSSRRRLVADLACF